MPPADLEALVSACAGSSGENKIACETLAVEEQPPDEDSDAEQTPPDFPPESFWLSKDAEFDWLDRNAFYGLKESVKGNSCSTNLNPSSTSSSQRFSANLKSKGSIIGLPRPLKPWFVGPKHRRNAKPGNTRLFPELSGSNGKSYPPAIEPSSPKVSCIGRVRSKKHRSRRLRSRQRSQSFERETAKAKPAGRKKAGFFSFSSFRSMFLSGKKSGTESEHHAPRRGTSPRRISLDIRERLPTRDFDAPSSDSLLPRTSATEGEPPGLSGMMRFSSGRRYEAGSMTWRDGIGQFMDVNHKAEDGARGKGTAVIR